jgi:UDP-3-O-[3-hydroxymyristoyl] N-acetylglucosamine deacetylase
VTRAAVAGVGLHTGARGRVALRACPGPVRIRLEGAEARVDELEVASTVRATTVRFPGGELRIATVEHAFAALAGLGVHEGVMLEVEGPEMPILDGAAAAWCDALASVGGITSAPRMRIARPAVIELGLSRYELEPSDAAVRVEVRIELDDPRLAPAAQWHGDAEDFRVRIAPARTFALARDVEELSRLGLARHVPPESVILITPDAIHWAGPAFSPDEPARHKLLDLLGDMYLFGGPALGRVCAVRPGHTANTHAFRSARAQGVLVPR